MVQDVMLVMICTKVLLLSIGGGFSVLYFLKKMNFNLAHSNSTKNETPVGMEELRGDVDLFSGIVLVKFVHDFNEFTW